MSLRESPARLTKSLSRHSNNFFRACTAVSNRSNCHFLTCLVLLAKAAVKTAERPKKFFYSFEEPSNNFAARPYVRNSQVSDVRFAIHYASRMSRMSSSKSRKIPESALHKKYTFLFSGSCRRKNLRAAFHRWVSPFPYPYLYLTELRYWLETPGRRIAIQQSSFSALQRISLSLPQVAVDANWQEPVRLSTRASPRLRRGLSVISPAENITCLARKDSLDASCLCGMHLRLAAHPLRGPGNLLA